MLGYILKSYYHLLAIFLVFILLILLHAIGNSILKPIFYENLINMVVKNSQSLVIHMIEYDNHLDKDVIINELEETKDNFDLVKIKYFDKNGHVIYSTKSTEIGTKSENDYFYKIVSNNQLFYKIEEKNIQKNEKNVFVNVAEIYVPITQNDQFLGAIELYVDITEVEKNFTEIIEKIEHIYFLISFLILVLTFIISYFSAKNSYQKTCHQCEIIKINSQLEEKVKEKTLELEKANEHLKQIAYYDNLTDLHSRSYFMKTAEKYFELCRRNNYPFYVIVFDLDKFKNVNDTYGHHAGDIVIQDFAHHLKKYERRSDISGRIGGEEFVSCLQATNESGVKIFTEKIRKSVESSEVFFNSQKIKYTVSIGVAKLVNHKDFKDLLDDADKALYNAKNNGRNQVNYFN